jgi:hypothetical protein
MYLPDFSPPSAIPCAVAALPRSVRRGLEADGTCGMNSTSPKWPWLARTGAGRPEWDKPLVLKMSGCGAWSRPSFIKWGKLVG